MDADHSVDRRQLTFGLTALATAFAVPSLAAAQTAQALAWTPKALTPAQAKILDIIAELIIPATGTPGAREAGVPQFVDRAVATYCTPANALAVRTGLDRMEADAQAGHGMSFVALTPDQQVDLLTHYDAEAAPQTAAPFFPVLKDLVTVGYFTSQLGSTKAVRWDPVPGPYRGCVPVSEIGRSWAV